MKKKILVIDDDELVLETIRLMFTELDCQVETFTDAQAGIAAAGNNDFDMILTDIQMPQLTGDEVVKRILSIKPKSRIWIMTAYPADLHVQKAFEAGALGIMKKPFDFGKIMEFLRYDHGAS